MPEYTYKTPCDGLYEHAGVVCNALDCVSAPDSNDCFVPRNDGRVQIFRTQARFG